MKEQTISDYRRRIENVIEHIQFNLDQDSTIEKLASIACLSPFHFHRIFKGMIGEGVAEFSRRLKIERAAANLRYEQFSITHLAMEAGYDSTDAFTRAFKKQYGVTPSAFRAQKQEVFKRQYIKPLGVVSMKVEMKKIGTRTVLAVRHLGPYQNCSVAWEKLCSFAGRHQLINGDSKFYGVCYDDPEVTDSSKVRYDACLSFEGELKELEEGVRIFSIPEANYAVTLHQGPLDHLKDTYAKLCGHWAPTKGVEFTSAYSIEVYLNDPNTTAPKDLLVEVQMPIKE